MLAPLDQIEQGCDIITRRAKRPRRDLAVKDLRGDIGVVIGALPSTKGAVFTADAGETGEVIGEGFKFGDFQHGPPFGKGWACGLRDASPSGPCSVSFATFADGG